MSLMVCLTVLGLASIVNAQSRDRRGEPNVLSTGYYVVDSDDDAPEPWRPNYFFVDTNYNPTEWRRIASGPQQFALPGQFFMNPKYTNFPQMDTTNEAFAGPIYMNLGHAYSFYAGNYDSVYVSSNGFIGFGPWSVATANISSNPDYARGNNVDLKSSPSGAPKAAIFALWADLDLRAFGDTSRVYYRTSTSLDTFMVNYYMVRLRPGSPNSFAPAGFSSPGADRIFVRKLQIVLANTDSSIQVNYGSFTGSINGFPPVLAWRLFQNNSAIGIVNENGTQSTSVLYKNRWDAKNAGCKSCNKDLKQSGQWAIKYKRWHNVVRAIQVLYPPRNYEICLGQAVTPRATFKNVDSVMHSFKVRFQIRNVVTGNAVYSRAVSLINVLPGQSVDTSFGAYATNPNILSQLGTFRACAIATTYDTADVNIGDRWPFDDTTCIRVFGVRRTTQPFIDPSNYYSHTTSADIPDQTKWISIGAQVVEGDDASWDPPPPRDPDVGYGADQFHSPVIRLDRTDVDGNTYAGSNVGDTLMSFPINLQGYTKANLTFDFQRSGQMQYPWLFDADVMLGPEHTVLDIYGNVLRRGDSLSLEFKKPTEPGCNPSASGWTTIKSIDGGHDFEFQKYFLRIDSFTRTGFSYMTADFRFRLRLKAKYDGAFIPPPSDDDDPWYVDNPTVEVPRKPEIEVMWVRVVNPFTKIPASQAVSLPVYAKIANTSSNVAIAFPIRVLILDPNGEAKYLQTVTVNSLNAGTDSVITMPNWNAQNSGTGGGAIYTIHAWIAQAGYDTYEEDNGTYTKFALNVEQGGGLTQEFAWDDAGVTPSVGSGNDIPGVTLISGDGIGWNNKSGSFASKFRLSTKDTVYGVRVYFSNSNQSPDALRISLMNGSPEACTPLDTVQQQGVQATFEDVRRGGYFNQFWPYYFPKPIVLPGGADAGSTKGIYWISVSQLSLDNMMNGGDLSRGGGYIRVYDPLTPQIPPMYTSPYGTQYKANDNTGDVSCAWALEVTAGSGAWARWTPFAGWWPTMANAGLPLALRTNINTGYMIWGGSYTPMIRPLVSRNVILPIELVYLHGIEQNGSALLTWATSQETDNAGFFVERKNSNVPDEMWSKIGFVGSKNRNSATETGYSYVDRNVTPGTYQYRLIQMDANGVEHVTNSVEVSVAAPKSFALEQNVPNPYNPTGSSTSITYSVPVAAPTTLVIYNALGQVVKTLVNDGGQVGVQTVRWDGKDEAGNEVAAGNYIYKLTCGEYSTTRKLTVSK
jgi:hypothetical protein